MSHDYVVPIDTASVVLVSIIGVVVLSRVKESEKDVTCQQMETPIPSNRTDTDNFNG